MTMQPSKGAVAVVLAAAVLMAGLEDPAVAEGKGGSLTGRVTDEQGARLPGATVTVSGATSSDFLLPVVGDDFGGGATVAPGQDPQEVVITLGTDHPSWGEYLSPFSVHRELHAMVVAGLPPAAALRAGAAPPGERA